MRGPFGSTDHLHSFPEIDVIERFPQTWKASYPDGLCTGNNSALLLFRVPNHDYWGGSGDLDLLTVDASLLEGEVTIVEVTTRDASRQSESVNDKIAEGVAQLYQYGTVKARS